MNLKIATTPFHHQLYIIQSSCVKHYFLPLVVLFFILDFIILCFTVLRVGQEVEEPKEHLVLEVQAGEVNRKTGKIMLIDTSVKQRVTKCCLISTILLQIESNR